MFYNQARLSFLRRMLQIRRNFLTTCKQKSIQEAKSQAYVTFSGRSMVEMLGVLAIIGVLSVGAISGYSKAMMKYKLNKYTESFSMLLANAIQISTQLPKAPTPNRRYPHLTVMHKLNLIPDGITFLEEYPSHNPAGEKAVLKDIFQNEIVFFTADGFGYNWALSTIFSNTSYSSDMCYSFLYVAKAYSSELNWIIREDRTADTYSGNYIYGDKYCNAGQKPCLRELTFDDISIICRIETEKNDQGYYDFSMTWD